MEVGKDAEVVSESVKVVTIQAFQGHASCNGKHACCSPDQHMLALPYGVIIRSRHQGKAVWAEGHTGHRGCVPLQHPLTFACFHIPYLDDVTDIMIRQRVGGRELV